MMKQLRHFLVNITATWAFITSICLHAAVAALLYYTPFHQAILPDPTFSAVPISVVSIQLGQETAVEKTPPAPKLIPTPMPVKTAHVVKPTFKTKKQKIRATKPEPHPVPDVTADARTQKSTKQITQKAPKGSQYGNRAVGKTENLAYRDLLLSWFDRHKHYPREALIRRREGDAVIKLVITQSGEIKAYKLVQRTGHRTLDRAIITALKRAGNAPPIPSHFSNKAEMSVDLPVSFRVGHTS